MKVVEPHGVDPKTVVDPYPNLKNSPFRLQKVKNVPKNK